MTPQQAVSQYTKILNSEGTEEEVEARLEEFENSLPPELQAIVGPELFFTETPANDLGTPTV